VTRGTFERTLAIGLNFISLPLRPDTPLTAQAMISKLGVSGEGDPIATMLVQFDEADQTFVPYLPGLSNDFPLHGGVGYIVNVTEAKTVTFTGTVWDNVNAAPDGANARFAATSTPVWTFVVGGTGKLRTRPADRAATVTVRNLRTGKVRHTVQDTNGRYATVFADLSRQGVVEAGDVLEIGVDGIDGLVHHKISLEDLRRAFARIDIHPQNVQPVRTVLLQNYPNPFNPETWMPYQLSSDTDVHITIYDINGAIVRRLDLGHQGAGFYRNRHRAAYWDGRSETGELMSSGLYFYYLRAGDFTATRRMVIVK
jgi:hypothetical protein